MNVGNSCQIRYKCTGMFDEKSQSYNLRRESETDIEKLRTVGMQTMTYKEGTSNSKKFNILEIRFVDVHGRIIGMNQPIKPVDTLQEVIDNTIFQDGFKFDGSSVPGMTEIQDSDLLLELLPETIIELPYTEDPKAAVLAEIHQNGEIFAGDTRSQLKRILEKELGPNRRLMVGPEPEFFILKEGKPLDQATYGDIYPTAPGISLLKRLCQALMVAGIEANVSHHEVSPGQHEIELGFTEALRAADLIITYKQFVRGLAAKMGYGVTFMPKPFTGINGSGMHMHLSLWEGEENLFAEKNGELSSMAKHFMAGVLTHAKGLSVLVSPTVNSYKRLVPGFEAPVYIAWGHRNRSTLLRVPTYRERNGARFEYRAPDPSCNPYIAIAGIVKAGMEGVRKELELPPEIRENIYKLSKEERNIRGIETLPENLGEAVKALQTDPIVSNSMTDHTLQRFIEIKNQEWMDYTTQITDWDWERYLHV